MLLLYTTISESQEQPIPVFVTYMVGENGKQVRKQRPQLFASFFSELQSCMSEGYFILVNRQSCRNNDLNIF